MSSAPRSPSTSANIGVLYLDSKERGRFSSSAPIAVEALATEAATAIENARLYRESMEKAKIDRRAANGVANSAGVAARTATRRAFYVAVGASVPSRMIGGDFFDYLDLSGGAFGFALGDVTGKGPPAALVTAMIQGIFGSTRERGGTERSDRAGQPRVAVTTDRVASRHDFLRIDDAARPPHLLQCRAESAAAVFR